MLPGQLSFCVSIQHRKKACAGAIQVLAARRGGNTHRVAGYDLVVQARYMVDVVCLVEILDSHIDAVRRDVDGDVILVHVAHTVQEHLYPAPKSPRSCIVKHTTTGVKLQQGS